MTEQFIMATLTTALASGTPITSLAVSATQSPIGSGESLTVGYGASGAATVTTSAAVAIGSTAIPINTFTPGQVFPVGAVVADTSALQVGVGAASGTTLNTSAADYAAPNATATGTQIVAANTARKSITLKNISASVAIRIGSTAASVANGTIGHHLGAGGSITFTNYNGALFGNGTASGATLSYAEEAA